MVRKLRTHTVALVVLLLGCHLTLWQTWNGFCQDGDAAPPEVSAQLRAYKARLAIDGTQTQVRLKLAKVYLQIEAYTEAVDAYRHVIAAVEASGVNPKESTDIATAYYGLGLAFTGLEKFADAIAAYQRVIAQRPDWSHPHAALAGAYVNMHRYAEALAAYKIALDLDPNDAMMHHQIGNVHSKRGDHAAAMHHQRRAVAISPEFAAAHYQLGLLYAKEKTWDAAIRAYQTAYAHDETLIEALYNLAQAYRRAGDTDAAREQMHRFETRKATLLPLQTLKGTLQRTEGTAERAQILANIGRLYLKNGFYEKAVWEYQKAVAMDGELVPAYNGLGVAYTMLGKHAESVKAQQRALELRPDFAQAHAGLGLTYFRQNALDSALDHYRRAADMDPDLLDAHLKIGVILLTQERYAEAIDTYHRLLEMKGDDPDIYYNLGLCYAHQARRARTAQQSPDQRAIRDLADAALTALEKAIGLSAASDAAFLPEAYYLIGEIQAGNRDEAAAARAYLKSGLPKAYHALARLAAQPVGGPQGVDLEKARRYAEEAIRLAPDVASYYNTLALIDFQRGDYLQAERAIRKALALQPENRNYQEGLKQISGKIRDK